MKKTDNAPAAAFNKEQLIKSGEFNKDAARGVLRADRQYTLAEARAAVDDFLRKEVK